MENNAAGLGRCMIAMARKYAPNAKADLHASPWATRMDVYLNTDASFDMAGEAHKVADFLLQVGGSETDFVVVEASDRDAGFYQSQGEDVWWDATNATRPNFHQAFAWAKALSERMNKPNMWWQLPVGNMDLPDTNTRWRDNRVDYFFTHADEVAAAHSVGFSFGAGGGAANDAGDGQRPPHQPGEGLRAVGRTGPVHPHPGALSARPGLAAVKKWLGVRRIKRNPRGLWPTR